MTWYVFVYTLNLKPHICMMENEFTSGIFPDTSPKNIAQLAYAGVLFEVWGLT